VLTFLPENEIESILAHKERHLKNPFAVGGIFMISDIEEAKRNLEIARNG